MTHLDFICDLPQIHIAPASRRPHRQKRTPNTGIHKDKPLICLIETVFCENLGVCAKVIAIILALHDSDIRLIRDERSSAGLAIHDKHEVGGLMEAMRQEED